MKEQIEEIFLGLYENYIDGTNWDKAIISMQQLMCYREVYGILQYMGLDGLCPEHEDALVMQLMPNYPTKMIWNAIDQYKSEHQ